MIRAPNPELLDAITPSRLDDGGGTSGSTFPSSPCDPSMDRVLRRFPEFTGQSSADQLSDFLAQTGGDPRPARETFARLRWGGLYAYSSDRRHPVNRLSTELSNFGFVIEEGPASVRRNCGFLPFPLPLISRKTHYLVARKALLIPPGQITDRFTYDVRLVHPENPNDPLIVLKQVPTLESVMQRLRHKFPDVAADVIERRARKFTEKIFPIFLTREAAMLMILDDYLPSGYRRRVPRIVRIEKDSRGFVRKLWMNWLRNGGRPLPQIEFARQSIDLLRVIHDVARVIHLDLRLDNFVITPEGVGFVDFGSAVRENENIHENPLLSSVFDELMRTSQIQRMLDQMTLSGHVTSEVIRRSHHKADKAIDFFYLAVQFNCPHANPDLADLIRYDRNSNEAHALARLTAEVLRPANPAHPPYRSAKDILHAIERLQRRLERGLE